MKAFLLVAALCASLLVTTGCCSHTETTSALQREQERYWTAVTDNLTFNRGTSRQQAAIEVRTRTTVIRRTTVTDK